MKLVGWAIWVSVLSAACGSSAPYVWVESLPAQASAQADDLVIKDTDTVNVRVFNQEPLSTREHVRSDGKISIPVVGEIVARGKKPSLLAKEIEEKLKTVVVAPSVVVVIEQTAQFPVSVIGEVKNAGTFPMDPGATVLNALATAGGLSDYASSDRVFVVRKGKSPRIRFRYEDLRGGEEKAVNFSLQPGDVVVVE